MNRAEGIPSNTAAQLLAVQERRLSADEVRAAIAAPIGAEERADVLSLVRWFCQRYPQPADRLAYARRAYARWNRTRTAQ